MNKTKNPAGRLARVSMVAVALFAAVMTGSTASALAYPEYAQPDTAAVSNEAADTRYGLRDLVIHNVGTSGLSICKDWNLADDQVVSSYCPSTIGLLNPGQDSKSKYGWADTDGAFIPARTGLYVDGKRWNHCRSYAVWMKLSPTLFDHHYDITKKTC